MEKWAADQATGKVDYNFRATGNALNAPGTVAGPCYRLKCSWKVEGRYSNGTVQRTLGTIASGTLAYDTASLDQSLSGILQSEVTEIKTVVDPGSCYACSQARTRYDSGWIKVGDPYATGTISLGLKTWERDRATGSYSYDLAVNTGGAAQVGGPCFEKSCRWIVEARYGSGYVGALASERMATGTWSVNRTISGTVSGGTITELRATLDSMCGVSSSYWCWDPWETYTTGWLAVSDAMVQGEDLVGFEVALSAALVANPSTFCDPLAVAGGALPSVDGQSPPDAWQRCVEAIRLYGPNIRKVLLYVAGAAGGATALHMLLDEKANEGPVPTPEEEDTPAPPWIPPDGWEDDGCYWQSIHFTADSEDHMKKHGHIYEYRMPNKSWFYPWVTPNLRSLAERHALAVMPTPDPTNGNNCRRVVRHLTNYVGIDRRTDRRTKVYTVITNRDSGQVVTMFPGEP